MEILNRQIKALSISKINEGSIGFITNDIKDVIPGTDKPIWFNVLGDPNILEELVKNVVAKGNTIEFEYNNGVVGSLRLISKPQEKKSDKFDDMTNFEALLDAAHKEFCDKLNIKTELIQVDFDKKRAVFSATVSIEYGEEKVRVFTAHGDAEGIGSKMIEPHFMRMAETRAIARALRWATNNAKVAVEETTEVPKTE